MQLKGNTAFANRYQLERLLGRGGFSEVWLAKDNWTHLRIALKVYAPGQGMDANGLQDFCGELANVFDLNHTNLLKPTHVDTWNDMPYLIMAYCSQGSLASKIGNMSEEQIWKLIHDVASGLAYLHGRDVVHQDIKPDNILLDEFGNYVITDFGISTRARSTLRKSVVGGSASGGTTAYMGPERFSRQPAPTKASDIWSFGAMVYEVLESNVPFGEVGGGLQKGGAEIPFITADVSDAMKFTVYKMLSKETWDRPTAETLVTWSQNPQAIEIDYDLLTAEEPNNEGNSEPVVASSRHTQRFSASSSKADGLTLSTDTINALSEPNIYHTVDIKSDSTWNAKTSDNAGWLHCYKRGDGVLAIWCDQNDKSESRSAHVYVSNDSEQKSIYVTQKAGKATTSGSGSKVWLWILLPIFLIIGGTIGVAMHNQAEQERQEKNRVYSRHTNAISDFNSCLNAANIDNIDQLEQAYKQLQIIREVENHRYFNGTRRYNEKQQALKSKAQELYNEADRRYQIAPSDSPAETRNKNKRRQIAEIKQKI